MEDQFNGIEKTKVSFDNGTENSTRSSKCKKVDYDTLLSTAGEFGRYQVFLFFVTFPFYIYGVFSYFTQLFITEVSSNHWCWIPDLENLTEMERRNLAIPADPASRFGYSQCKMYIANWTEVLTEGTKPDDTWNITSCQHGWEFDKSEIPYPTISSELGWVCEQDSNQATAQSIFFVGCIFGGFIVGWVSDRFGRIPAAVLSNVFACVGGIVSIFARNLTEFALCRFLMGMSYDNCMIMVYLLVMEYMAPKYRSLISNLPFALFYTLGLEILPWIALVCNDWRLFSIVTSLPFALALLTPLIVPESPRWLLSKDRVDDAVQKLVRIGKVNKKEIPTKMIEEFKHSLKTQEENNGENMVTLMTRPLLRGRLICMCLLYMSAVLVFDALVRSIDSLPFDFFLSFSIVSLTELPSLLLISFVLDYTGRKCMCIVVMTISALFSILTGFVGDGVAPIACAVIARFAINIAVNSALLWAAEILPTSVRGSGVAIVHISGYVGTVVAPFIVYLEVYITWLPVVITGCIAAFGGILATLMPETSMKELPQTFDAAEDLIRNQKLWEIPCLKKNNSDVTGTVNTSFEI